MVVGRRRRWFRPTGPEQPALDVCDRRGARTLGFTSDGEWVKYRVDVRRRGTYDVSARVGSPYTPAVPFVLEWDGQPGRAFQIQNTTNPEVFERQPVERRYLEPGVHELVLRIPAGVELPQYVNIGYFQLDIVRGPVAGGQGV